MVCLMMLTKFIISIWLSPIPRIVLNIKILCVLFCLQILDLVNLPWTCCQSLPPPSVHGQQTVVAKQFTNQLLELSQTVVIEGSSGESELDGLLVESGELALVHCLYFLYIFFYYILPLNTWICVTIRWQLYKFQSYCSASSRYLTWLLPSSFNVNLFEDLWCCTG